MNTNYYMTYNGHQLATKNKLEKEVSEYIKTLDRTLVHETDLPKFKEEFLKNIDDISKKHPRCKPLKPYWDERRNSDIFLSGIYFNHFTIYHVKTVY